MQWFENFISGLVRFLVVVRWPLFAALAVVTSEWLFIVTKLSFLSQYSFFEKFLTWFQTSLLVCGSVFMLLASAWVVLNFNDQKGRELFSFLATITGALLLTFLTILMVDNFTYTLLGFGIRNIRSSMVSVAVIFIIIVLLVSMFNWCKTHQVSASVLQGTGTTVMVTVLLILFGGGMLGLFMAEFDGDSVGVAELNPPPFNIIIIGIDGLEADHMSVYGYQRDTTPFLEAKQSEFMISENSFTNHSPSFGSIGALLTGKYPTTTHLIYPPDKLTGEDQFDHLPGILHSVGYRSLDMSLRWYADPVDMNIRCGFDLSNFRVVSNCDNNLTANTRWLLQLDLPLILIGQIRDRVTERIEILNPWSELTSSPDGLLRVGQPALYWHKDHSRIQAAVEFIELENDQPFLINLHLMSTHGPVFLLDTRKFSQGQVQITDWQDDFYDDAIRQVDGHIEEIYRTLQLRGLLDSTVLVITSDHGTDQSFETRLPLMIRFPYSQHRNTISSNTQRLDIAPTLLDYIGLGVPVWMEGDSLVEKAPFELKDRPIFQTRPSKVFDEIKNGTKSANDISPPFYSLGGLSIILCDKFFSLDLEEDTWQLGEINGHTKPCQENGLFEKFDYMSLARDHLLERGYELQSMQNFMEDSVSSDRR